MNVLSGSGTEVWGLRGGGEVGGFVACSCWAAEGPGRMPQASAGGVFQGPFTVPPPGFRIQQSAAREARPC